MRLCNISKFLDEIISRYKCRDIFYKTQILTFHQNVNSLFSTSITKYKSLLIKIKRLIKHEAGFKPDRLPETRVRCVVSLRREDGLVAKVVLATRTVVTKVADATINLFSKF